MEQEQRNEELGVEDILTSEEINDLRLDAGRVLYFA